MKISNSIIIVFSILLTGCSPEKEAETEVKTEAEQNTKSEAKKKQTKILAPHLKTLNQAKDMEKSLQDAEAARKKKMDEQEEASEDDEPN